jgi:calcineurin-like phosphoesterase family protein
MERLFTADNHWGHYNIIKHCNRPWSIEDHDDALVARWNAVVSKRDIVYHLGDFAMFKSIPGVDRMKAYRKLRMRLNGKIHLVLGNHDRMSSEVYDTFTEVYPGLKEITIEKQKITLCHYPMRSWNCSFHGAWNLHGHVHGRMEGTKYGLIQDMGVDVPDWNYAPVPWETIKAKMETKLPDWEKMKSSGTSRG